MNRGNLQVIEGGQDTAKHVRESVHAQAVVLRHGIQAVARRNGLSYNDVIELVVEQERINAAIRERAAFRNGKLSNWKVAA